MKCSIIYKNIVKRKTISVFLGLVFGLLCVFLASMGQESIWGSILMWMIIVNRVIIGAMVFLAGFIKFHPICGIRMYPLFRGFVIGAFVSLDLALGVFMEKVDGESQKIFWMTIIAGGVYGAIIDFIATKFSAEGEDLLKK